MPVYVNANFVINTYLNYMQNKHHTSLIEIKSNTLKKIYLSNIEKIKIVPCSCFLNIYFIKM